MRLEEIRASAERAAALTRQLLAFSRRQVLNPVNIHLNVVVADTLKMLRRVIGADIHLEFRAGNDLLTVLADEQQVGQILLNLCVNARDAMPEGGRIVLSTENVEIGEQEAEGMAWARAGRFVRLTVADSGVGMKAEVLERVFEPFFTTKALGRGTGLGLATVYGIVKQHEGLIHVESEEGRGTEVHVLLEVVDAPPQVPEVRPKTVPPVGRETVLVAEDEEIVRELTGEMLRNAGYEVLLAPDGPEAVRVFENHPGRIDLAFLDVVMPGFGGREVHDRIKERCPGVTVLFTSGYSGDAVPDRYFIDEGTPLLQKPYDRATLLRTVREVLDAG